MRSRRAPGRPSRLDAVKLAEMVRLYEGGPLGNGTGRWTALAFRDAIFERLGVRYHADHVGLLMHRLGWREGAAAGGGR
jgi:transposase